jgi:hypothetical protein
MKEAARERRWRLFLIALGTVLVAGAIFFAFVRDLSPSWSKLMTQATLLVDRGRWNKALAEYKQQIALYQFDRAAGAIRNVKLVGASFATAKEIAEKKAQLLIDWKNSLIYDLNVVHFSGSLTDKTGAQYTGIAGATHDSLSMKLSYGIARVTWDQLSPKELLAISRSFIKPGASDAPDRQWRCAVFASETGQTDAARELAAAAARAKSEYREQIAQLLPDIAQAFHLRT